MQHEALVAHHLHLPQALKPPQRRVSAGGVGARVEKAAAQGERQRVIPPEQRVHGSHEREQRDLREGREGKQHMRVTCSLAGKGDGAQREPPPMTTRVRLRWLARVGGVTWSPKVTL